MRYAVPTGKRVAVPTGCRLSVPAEESAYIPPIDYAVSYAFGLRTIKEGYSGALIRLRRDSDEAESDFSAVDGILDTAAIATWLGAANGFATTWYDQSGSNRNAVQATADNQPKYIASHNGRAAIYHDGANDYLRNTGLDLAQPFEALCVWQTDTQDSKYFYSSADATKRASLLSRAAIHSAAGEIAYWAGGAVVESGVDVTDADTHYTGIQYDGASSIMRYDGAELASGSAGNESQNGLTLCASYLATLPFVGHLYELIESSGGLLSSGQRTAIEADQASYYGVS